jgi:predicted amidohydrolase YtcJ
MAPVPADLLFAGGTILTMATPSTAEALAVRGGRIHAVGSLQECRARIGSAMEVDLAGRSLMPAFVDAHCHPILLAQARTWTDVAPGAVRSIEEMVQALHRAAELVDAQAPLRAFGYDPTIPWPLVCIT